MDSNSRVVGPTVAYRT